MNPPPVSSLTLKKLRSCRRGFSLVEVVLAVGVMAFAFVAILGLLPVGMTQFRQAIDTTVCSQIAQRVIGDAQQTDFDTLIDKVNLPTGRTNSYVFRAPEVNNPGFRYFDERGGEVVPSSVAARSNPASLTAGEKLLVVYHVNTRIMPQTPMPSRNATADGGQEMATLTIQIASNPSNRPINLSPGGASDDNDPTRRLFIKTPGITILTYSAQVARNQ